MERIPENLRPLFLLNPMTGIIAAYRDVFLNQQWPDWIYLGGVLLFSILLIASSTAVINRFNKIYPKIV